MDTITIIQTLIDEFLRASAEIRRSFSAWDRVTGAARAAEGNLLLGVERLYLLRAQARENPIAAQSADFRARVQREAIFGRSQIEGARNFAAVDFEYSQAFVDAADALGGVVTGALRSVSVAVPAVVWMAVAAAAAYSILRLSRV